MVTTGVPGAVNTQAYFDAERHLLQTIFDGEIAPYVVKKSIVSMSYFNGLEVDYASAQAYFNVNSTSYNTTYASQYRMSIENLWNTDKSAFLITMETSVNPDSEDVVPFIKDMRKLLIQQSDTPFVPTLPVGLYLLGSYCSSLDLQVRTVNITIS